MFERSRKRSFIAARHITEKTPDIHEKILADLASKKEVEVRKKEAEVQKIPSRQEKKFKIAHYLDNHKSNNK